MVKHITMNKNNLNLTLVQPDLTGIICCRTLNFLHYEKILENHHVKDIMVLPEMFSTGFITNYPQTIAENEDSSISIQFMEQLSIKHNCNVIGSVIINENNLFYNRLFSINKNNNIYYKYDKNNLFPFGLNNETLFFTPGKSKQLIIHNEWKIKPIICYDLRFPLLTYNKGYEYDVLLVIASWPKIRSHAWSALLKARAIENQCYVVAVNFVGTGWHNTEYNGLTSVYDPLGELLYYCNGVENIIDVCLTKQHLDTIRTNFPILKN